VCLFILVDIVIVSERVIRRQVHRLHLANKRDSVIFKYVWENVYFFY